MYDNEFQAWRKALQPPAYVRGFRVLAAAFAALLWAVIAGALHGLYMALLVAGAAWLLGADDPKAAGIVAWWIWGGIWWAIVFVIGLAKRL